MHDTLASSTSPWLIWQVIDSAFPIGGFAHSGGLEAAVQFGFVRDAQSLDEFLHVSLTQTAQLSAPFVAAVVRDPDRFESLSRHYETLLVNTPANRASRALGSAVLAAGETIDRSPLIAATRIAARREKWPVHYPVAFGLLARALQMPAEDAVDAFLFQQARSLLSAAVRLGVAGPMESQRMLAALGAKRAEWLAIAARTTPETAAQSAPTIDLLQSLHERLYSRLFNS